MKKEELTSYTEKCDIFSVGVIFYILLAGQSPFPSSNYKKVLKMNKKCVIDFTYGKLVHVTPECIKIFIFSSSLISNLVNETVTLYQDV